MVLQAAGEAEKVVHDLVLPLHLLLTHLPLLLVFSLFAPRLHPHVCSSFFDLPALFTYLCSPPYAALPLLLFPCYSLCLSFPPYPLLTKNGREDMENEEYMEAVDDQEDVSTNEVDQFNDWE